MALAPYALGAVTAEVKARSQHLPVTEPVASF
jgi:hypothetical protein